MRIKKLVPKGLPPLLQLLHQLLPAQQPEWCFMVSVCFRNLRKLGAMILEFHDRLRSLQEAILVSIFPAFETCQFHQRAGASLDRAVRSIAGKQDAKEDCRFLPTLA